MGYGDYSAASNGEMAYSMVVEIVGILFFAYLTGTVTSVILNKRKLDIIQRQNDIDKWLMLLDKNRPEKRISSALYIKIRNFFDYIHFNDHSYLINDSDFLMQLPPSIR